MDNDRNENIKRVRELIKDIRFAMLTTLQSDGSLRSRPMATQQLEFDGDLWFFTYGNADKVHEVKQNPHVNLSYAATNEQKYVSISGTGELVRDRDRMEQLWNPVYRAWFPQGLDEPDLALLKVSVDQAEYWDSPSNSVVRLAGFVKAVVTGDPSAVGSNEKISGPLIQDT